MTKKIFLSVLILCGSLSAQIAIVNNASFRGDQPVAAGSWAAAFGSFTGVATTTAATFPLPKSLGGVKVTIEGVDAPVYDVRATQVTFLIPSALTAGVHPVVVTTPSATINGSVRLISSAPGMFTKDAMTPPRVAARNQDGVTENTSSTPAKRGEIVSLYGTGPGAFDRAIEDGAAPGATPLARTKSTPQVFIGGVEAVVQFSGLNPDAPGLWQVNVFVPNLPFITGKVAVRVFADGVDSNEVGLFVQ
ncbi:MAG: hypothetical protein ABI823_10335 [Bryobacteraceae bacterium]